MATRTENIQKSQNESKRAIVNSVADDLADLNRPLSRAGSELIEVISSLAVNWQGAAYETMAGTLRNISEDLKSYANKTKTISTGIKNAAKQVYP